MTNKIQHLALNSLPSTVPDAGSIIYLSSGSQYVTTSNGTYIKFSDLIFTDTLDTFGTVGKLYIHTVDGKAKLKVWNGIEYTSISGEEFDATQLESDIAQLQSDLVTLQGKVTTAESKITTSEGKISTLETKVADLESQNGNVDLITLQTQVDDIEVYVTDNITSISNINGKVITLEGRVSTLESIPPVDLSPIQAQIDDIETELTSFDGKVKLNNGDTSTYLDSKLDNDTLKVVNNKLVAMKLDGQLSTIAELNFLTGVTSNIQTQINSLSSVTNVRDEIVDSENDLPIDVDGVGTIILVRSDSTQNNSPTFYRSNGTAWIYVNKINNEIARDFATQPINLTTEVTGMLPKSNYEKQSASETDVEDSNGNFVATDVEGVLDELNTKINSKTSDISTIQGRVTILETDLDTVEDKTSTLESKVAILEAINSVDVSALEAQVGNIEDEITTIKSDISTNTNDISTLNNKVSSIESDIDTLENAINNLPAPQQITLNDTVTSTSSTEASTARAVKEAYDKGVEALDLANSKTYELPVATASDLGGVRTGANITNTTGTISVVDGSTTVKGVIQLNDTLTSTSINLGATANAVKQVADLANAKASTAVYTATISTTWTGTTAPYTQNITVTGILATDSPFVYPVYSSTNATALLEQETWFKIGKITTGTNTITVTCFEEKPTRALPIQLRVVR